MINTLRVEVKAKLGNVYPTFTDFLLVQIKDRMMGKFYQNGSFSVTIKGKELKGLFPEGRDWDQVTILAALYGYRLGVVRADPRFSYGGKVEEDYIIMYPKCDALNAEVEYV